MIRLFLKFNSGHFILKVVRIYFVLFTLLPFIAHSQEDSITSKRNKPKTFTQKDSAFYLHHSPRKATIYSMVLPGLGQAYNKKYWKIPIVYAGFGVFYYFISFNQKEYKAWSDGYYHSLSDPDHLESPVNDYEAMYGDHPDIMKDQKDYYRRNRDLTYILTGIWYLLNIVDATVDAHLYTWEIDDSLSLKFEPSLIEPMYGYRPNGGLKLTLNFK
jgi:hypothetical protein